MKIIYFLFIINDNIKVHTFINIYTEKSCNKYAFLYNIRKVMNAKNF